MIRSRTKLLPAGLLSVLSVAVLGSTMASSFLPTSAHAAAVPDTSDVHYSTVLDYSSTDILLEESGFAASSTYDCVIASNSCNQVPSSSQSLIPSALAGTSYYASPDYTEALITTYNPNASPTVKIEGIQNNVLVPQNTLPSLNALITHVHWSGDDTVMIISESDGSTQKYNRTTNSLTTLKTSIPSGASWVTISPDGRYIAYYIPAVISTGKRTFGVIDTTSDVGYTLNATIAYWDLLSEGVRISSFSPDSTKLLYLDDRSGYQTLYEVNLADLAAKPTTGLQGTEITSKPYTIMDMQWENNSTIVFSANRDNPMIWGLYELNLTTYAINKISDWVAFNQPMQKFGTNILFQTADANGRVTKVFNTLTKQITPYVLPGSGDSIIGTTSQVLSLNGLSAAFLPAQTATTTLLVWLHGGPDRQTSPEYNSYMSYGGYDWVLKQVQTAGVPVLKIDYPGSVNYGLALSESVKDGVGTVDASSTMTAITQYASAHGYKNVYIMGNSYGGYLALKLLVSYPKLISGVESLSGVTDWQTLLTNIPSSIFSLDFGGSPNASNQALYNKASIVNNLSAIGTQKVIVIQGNADTEVPYEQSQLINTALTAAGKNVSYFTLDGEDHIYEKPSSYTLVCNQTFGLVGLPTSSLCAMQ